MDHNGPLPNPDLPTQSSLHIADTSGQSGHLLLRVSVIHLILTILNQSCIIIICGVYLKMTAAFILSHTPWLQNVSGRALGVWVSPKHCGLSQCTASVGNGAVFVLLWQHIAWLLTVYLHVCFSNRYKPLEGREHVLFLLYPIFSYCPWDIEGI